MKSRGAIGIVVSVLLILALLVVFTDPWSTLRGEGRAIILKNGHKVDRIALWDTYDSTVLVKTAGEWFLFGEEPVKPVSVENLIFAAEKFRISSVESDFQGETGSVGTQVQFFSDDKLVLRFEIHKKQGRFLVRAPGSPRAYYVTLPGYGELDLSRVFNSASNHFREHILVDLMPSEIASLEVELVNGTGYGFFQDPEGNLTGYLLEGDRQIPATIGDELAVRLLLSYFTDIRFEERTTKPIPELDADPAGPLAMVKVSAKSGETHQIRVYPFYSAPGEDPHIFKAFVAYNDLPQALLINYIYLDVLMRDRTHYFAPAE